jgi:hypothetical protein
VADWSTVAISLGASGITGGTAIVVAHLNIRSRREEEWRTRQLEAANDFARQFVGAANAVEYAIGRRGEENGRADAERLVGEVTPHLGSISLLLGPESAAAVRAREAVDELKHAVDELQRSAWDKAETALAASRWRNAHFEQAALDVAGPKRVPWRRRPDW